MNGTFYSLQRPETYASWYAQTPDDFVFAIKGGKYITHERRLKDVREPLANFFASGLLALKEKLGPILWQFPAHMMFDAARFGAFFAMLPRDTRQVAELAREHGAWMKGRVAVEADAARDVRHAVEFRHESFLVPEFISLLREHGISLVVADVAGKFPTAEDATADFVYVRLHGSRKLYASGYSAREIAAWAEKIRAWTSGKEPANARRIGVPSKPIAGGRDVFVYFDNTDIKLRAPVDARSLAELLQVASPGSVAEIKGKLGAKTVTKAGRTKASVKSNSRAQQPASKRVRK